YFKTMENLKESFKKFAEKSTRAIIYNGDDKNTVDALKDIKKEKITFGFNLNNTFYASDIIVENCRSNFIIYKNKKMFCKISLKVPGNHNILNALAAIACADYENVPIDKITSALEDFKGAGRRFEHKGDFNGISLYDDYAHHPAEIEVTLNAAKTMGFKNIWTVFQPFTFSRTKMLLNDFSKALKIADKVVLAPIMGSREINIYDIYSSDLGDLINNSICLDTFEEIADYIKNNAKSGDMVITLGCGDIYKAGKLMLK
ncbi:MAG: cyanophycin synthetase, partial [Oscillospiraceae bacterium]